MIILTNKINYINKIYNYYRNYNIASNKSPIYNL